MFQTAFLSFCSGRLKKGLVHHVLSGQRTHQVVAYQDGQLTLVHPQHQQYQHFSGIEGDFVRWNVHQGVNDDSRCS